MPQVNISTRAQADIFRLYTFLEKKDELSAKRAVLGIKNAFNALRKSPMIGRPVEENLDFRELVIGFGSSGYVALHQFYESLDLVAILAIKHQKEDDYSV